MEDAVFRVCEQEVVEDAAFRVCEAPLRRIFEWQSWRCVQEKRVEKPSPPRVMRVSLAFPGLIFL